MSEDDNLDRRVRKPAMEHAETRWLTLRLDDDLKELGADLRAVRDIDERQTEVLDHHTAILQENIARFDSVDGQLRSLTQMVGQVLDRLPDEPKAQ